MRRGCPAECPRVPSPQTLTSPCQEGHCSRVPGERRPHAACPWVLPQVLPPASGQWQQELEARGSGLPALERGLHGGPCVLLRLLQPPAGPAAEVGGRGGACTPPRALPPPPGTWQPPPTPAPQPGPPSLPSAWGDLCLSLLGVGTPQPTGEPREPHTPTREPQTPYPTQEPHTPTREPREPHPPHQSHGNPVGPGLAVSLTATPGSGAGPLHSGLCCL